MRVRFGEARAEGGQSMVESALIFMLLITVVIGIIDFGFIFYGYISVVSAANEGAAFGATSSVNAGDASAIEAAALGETTNWNCLTQSVNSSTSQDSFGYTMVSVTVTCQVGNLIAIPEGFSAATVSSTARRRVRP